MASLTEFSLKYPQKSFKKGEIILHSDQVPTGVHFIAEGFVKFYSIDDDGSELFVGIDRVGESFPYGWIFGYRESARYYAEALTACLIHFLPREDFLDFLQHNADVLYKEYRQVVGDYMDMSGRINSLLQNGAHYKLLYSLRYLASRFGHPHDSDGRTVLDAFLITHQDMADFLGLSRETVSIEMKKLERAGILEHEGRYIMIDLENISKILG